jgi:glycosyltransferase involved in cell wall biosynthesis
MFPGVEDFGITPLESLAAGTPVIALKEGGVLETLNDDTAKFFHGNAEELYQAMRQFNPDQYSPQKLYSRAEQFTKERFKREIQSQIQDLLK